MGGGPERRRPAGKPHLGARGCVCAKTGGAAQVPLSKLYRNLGGDPILYIEDTCPIRTVGARGRTGGLP